MEGHAFLSVFSARNIDALMIRGISDLIDDKDAKPKSKDRRNQERAMQRVSAFAFELLEAIDPVGLRVPMHDEPVHLHITLETTKDRIRQLEELMAKIWNDPDFTVIESKIGSLWIEAEIRPISAEFAKATRQSKLLPFMLNIPVSMFHVERYSNDFGYEFNELIKLVKKLGHRNPMIADGAEWRLKEFRASTSGEEWKAAIAAVLEAYEERSQSHEFFEEAFEWLKRIKPSHTHFVKIWRMLHSRREKFPEIEEIGFQWLKDSMHQTNSWAEVWVELFTKNPRSQILYSLGVEWLHRNTKYIRASYRVWRNMIIQSPQDKKLREIAINRLKSFHIDIHIWSRIWRRLIRLNPNDDELATIAKNWIEHQRRRIGEQEPKFEGYYRRHLDSEIAVIRKIEKSVRYFESTK